MSKFYVPMLKWKNCEKRALLELSKDYKDKIKPRIEIQNRNFNKKKKTYSKDIDSYIQITVDELLKTFESRHFYLDAEKLVKEPNTIDGKLALESFIEKSLNSNLKFIPIIKSTSEIKVINVLKKYTYQDGICIHIFADDLSNLTNIDTILSLLNIENEKISLIIDFRYIDSLDLSAYNLKELNESKKLNSFREIIICSSTFPLSLNIIDLNKTGTVKKLELDFYFNLVPELELNTSAIHFADYSVINPDQPVDFDPLQDRYASVRYTHDKNYILVRGKLLEKGTFDQYYNLAERTISLEEYCGKNYSYGDAYFYNVATFQTESAGNPVTWLIAAINHHVVFTIDQLSNHSYF